ncbi:MAG: uracil-DNA glycosylase [Mycoplasma sp.]
MSFLINNVSTGWKQFISEQLSMDYLISIDSKLSNSTEIIYPNKENIFRAFNFFNPSETKVVIIGQDPYHGEGQADGLAFSIPNDQNILFPPSLRNIFKEIENEFNYKRINSDLSDWASQGVLLLNTSLTVFKGKANSHKTWGWKNLLINTIKYINENNDNVIFLLLGKESLSFEKYIDKTKHETIHRTHPSPLSVNQKNSYFFNTNFFIKINDILNSLNRTTIKW